MPGAEDVRLDAPRAWRAGAPRGRVARRDDNAARANRAGTDDARRDDLRRAARTERSRDRRCRVRMM